MIKETSDKYIVDIEVYVEEMNRYDYCVYLDKTLDGPVSYEDAYRMAAASIEAGNECVDDVEWGVGGDAGTYSRLGNNRQIDYQLNNLEKELHSYSRGLDCLMYTEPHEVKETMQRRVDHLAERIKQLNLARSFNTETNT